MNTKYESLLGSLQLPTTIVDSTMGRLRLPVAGVTYPPPWYGYPPALIPIWSEGYVYVGVWKHWFTDRPLSFVKMYVRADHSMIEVARTPDQFLCFGVITAIVAHDGVRPETERFAQNAGIRNLAEIDSATVSSGDDPKGFIAIRQFQIETPLASIADVNSYDGWFPRANFSSAIPWWQHCCSLEMDEDIRKAWPVQMPMPPAIAAPPTLQAFRNFVQAGDFRSAWLMLNSAGWPLPDARIAIGELATDAGDGMFSNLAEGWLMASEGQNGAY